MQLRTLTSALGISFLISMSPARARAADASEDLIDAYLAVHAALSADKTDGIAAAAQRLERGAASIAKRDKDRAAALTKGAQELRAAKDLPSARAAFKKVSRPIVAHAKDGYRGKRSLSIYSCSMAEASWVQEGTEVRNPYYGGEMLKCGERVVAK